MCLHLGRAVSAVTFALSVTTTVAIAQSREPAEATVGPFSGEPRFFAPFSADAVTRVVQRTPEGGRFERISMAKYYRDSFGRVRVEYAPGVDGGGDTRTVAMMVPNPYARTDRVFLIDDAAKLVEPVHFGIVTLLFNATRAFTIPTGSKRFTNFITAEFRVSGAGLFEDLGSQMIGGVRADGTRFTPSAWNAVDERWNSPDLDLVVHASEVDRGRGWEVEYTLTNIQRTEPPQHLFVMPAEYQYRQGEEMRLESPEAELNRVTTR